MTTTVPPPMPRRRLGEPLPPELFTLLERNVVPLLVVGTIAAIIGGAGIIAALALWITAAVPMTFFAGALIFFLSALVLAPAMHLLRYRMVLLESAQKPGSDAYELVLVQQRRFWRFTGLTTIFWLVAMALLMLAASLSS